MATNQAPKLARLLVRQLPGLPRLTVLDHDTSFVAGDDLKRAGRERYGHGGSLDVACPMRSSTQLIQLTAICRRYSTMREYTSRSERGAQCSRVSTHTLCEVYERVNRRGQRYLVGAWASAKLLVVATGDVSRGENVWRVYLGEGPYTLPELLSSRAGRRKPALNDAISAPP
jgi:hypothetical protein